MLNISKPLSASQAQTYHAKEFTAAEQNYWKQGTRYRENGMASWPNTSAFRVLSEQKSSPVCPKGSTRRPASNWSLIASSLNTRTRTGKRCLPSEHRAGWDATFSAPKSVSLTALVGGDDRVREAHREAVNVAINELERYTQARIGGNSVLPKRPESLLRQSSNMTPLVQ